MKNKKTTYFLLPIVLAVWGMIGWKVYAAFGGNEKNIVASNLPTEKINPAETSDTTSLVVNYRDPFLDKAVEKIIPRQSKSNSQNIIVKQSVPAMQTSAWPKLAYQGLIKKSVGEKATGFLTVDGKSFFVQAKQDLQDVTIGRLWKDSVEVFFEKEKKIIRK